MAANDVAEASVRCPGWIVFYTLLIVVRVSPIGCPFLDVAYHIIRADPAYAIGIAANRRNPSPILAASVSLICVGSAVSILVAPRVDG